MSESDLRFGVVDQLLRRAGEVRASMPPDTSDHVAAGARILELLGNLQDERPVVVFLDDAHWADVPSLRALLFVVRRLVADRVLVVITTRGRDGPAGGPDEGGGGNARPLAAPGTAHHGGAASSRARPGRSAVGASGPAAGGARRREPALHARAARRAAGRHLAPPGHAAGAALVRRDRDAARRRMLVGRGATARSRGGPRTALAARDRGVAGRGRSAARGSRGGERRRPAALGRDAGHPLPDLRSSAHRRGGLRPDRAGQARTPAFGGGPAGRGRGILVEASRGPRPGRTPISRSGSRRSRSARPRASAWSRPRSPWSRPHA